MAADFAGEVRVSGQMQIIEIYKSLQGESSFTGLPCVFVRLAGCNLRCHWCDSEYTFKGGVTMSSQEVAGEVRRLMPRGGLVEVTGGEPLLQERELIPLMKQLVESGYTLLLETNGERPLLRVPPAVFKIVDVKCPDSGAGESFRLENLGAISRRDELKFVIASRADYEFARAFTIANQLWEKAGNVIFSPAFRQPASGSRDAANCLLDPRELAEWILEDGLRVRVGLQIHKFIWDPALKGV
jgi:7-carboxy-7-deazaguanine synthase